MRFAHSGVEQLATERSRKAHVAPSGRLKLLLQAKLAATTLIGLLECGRQKFRTVTIPVFLPLPKTLHTRWIHKINPKDFRNVPSGVSG